MADLPAEEELERRARNRYILRRWVLGSVPTALLICLWLAWDSGLALPQLFSLRFLCVVAVTIAVSAVVGLFIGRLFWQNGLAPEQYDD
jgi:hypothetical protein